jgi:hypothetical protein
VTEEDLVACFDRFELSGAAGVAAFSRRGLA